MDISMKIKLTIDGTEHELTLEDAGQLLETLKTLLGKQEPLPTIPPPWPIPRDIDQYGWPIPPLSPITCGPVVMGDPPPFGGSGGGKIYRVVPPCNTWDKPAAGADRGGEHF
jgi:hypothetical protein